MNAKFTGKLIAAINKIKNLNMTEEFKKVIEGLAMSLLYIGKAITYDEQNKNQASRCIADSERFLAKVLEQVQSLKSHEITHKIDSGD